MRVAVTGATGLIGRALVQAHRRLTRLSEIRAEAERTGVRGVPSVLTKDGRTHWGMGGLERLLDGRPLIPREG